MVHNLQRQPGIVFIETADTRAEVPLNSENEAKKVGIKVIAHQNERSNQKYYQNRTQILKIFHRFDFGEIEVGFSKYSPSKGCARSSAAFVQFR